MQKTMAYLTNGTVVGLLLLCSMTATADNQDPGPTPKVIVKKFETVESISGEISSKVAEQLRTYGIDLENIEAELDTLNLDGRRIVIMRSDEDGATMPFAAKIFSDTLDLQAGPEQPPLNQAAADCVLARLAKMQISNAVTLLREACQARHPD